MRFCRVTARQSCTQERSIGPISLRSPRLHCGWRDFRRCWNTEQGEFLSAADEARASWIQIIRGPDRARVRARGHRDRRAEWMREVERLRCSEMGARRAACACAARREDGGSHLPGILRPPPREYRGGLALLRE